MPPDLSGRFAMAQRDSSSRTRSRDWSRLTLNRNRAQYYWLNHLLVDGSGLHGASIVVGGDASRSPQVEHVGLPAQPPW